MIKLEARLCRIAQFIPKCASFADIGANHGLLSAFVLTEGICQRAQLVDISEASLVKARALIDSLSLHDRAQIIVGDGAQALVEKPDCAVIAGMGGITIAGIVERGDEMLRDSIVVMQPNVGMYELRSRLARAGYAITNESVVKSFGRWYVIIVAAKGEAYYSDAELMAGPKLLYSGTEEFRDYVDFRISVAQKALSVEREGNDEPSVAMKRELAIWKEVQKCL